MAKKRTQIRSVVFFDSLSAYLDIGIEQVHGWLERTSATIIAHLAAEQVQAGLTGDVAEIGVHHGKLFILLANSTTSAEMAHAVDVFSNQQDNVDHSGAGDRAIFESNLRKFAPRAKVNIIQESSLKLEKVGFGNLRLRLLSIDGGHTAAITLNDLRLAERCMIRRGIVVLDDILNSHWLGVLSGLADYLHGNGRLIPFAMSPNKVYLSTDRESARFYRATLRRGFPLALQKCDVELFGVPIDIYGDHPYYDRVQSAGLRCQLNDLEIERDGLQSQVGALTAERDTFEKVIEDLNSQLAGQGDLKIERDDLKSQVGALTAERDTLQKAIEDLNSQLAGQGDLKTERDDLKPRVGALTVERDTLQKAIEDLNSQLAGQDHLKTEREDLKSQVGALTAERDTFQKAIEDLNSQLAGQDHLNTVINDLKSQVGALTAERDAFQKDIEGLHSELTGQQQRLEETRRSRDEILKSSSWKITSPLRQLVYLLRR